MKYLLLSTFAVLGFVSPSWANPNCPDLAGNYFHTTNGNIDGHAVYTQEDCARVFVVSWCIEKNDQIATVINADGVLREWNHASDGTDFLVSFAFTSEKLINVTIMRNEKYNLDHTSTTFASLDKENQLVFDTTVVDNNGAVLGHYSDLWQRDTLVK